MSKIFDTSKMTSQEFQKAMDSLDGIVYSAPKEQENESQSLRPSKEAIDAVDDLPTKPARHFDKNEINDAYEASVNKVVDTIENEIAANKLSDEKLLGSVIATMVRRHLGDISVDGADIVRSRGDQCWLVESLTEACIEDINDYAKDYIEYKFYGKSEKDWYSVEPI